MNNLNNLRRRLFDRDKNTYTKLQDIEETRTPSINTNKLHEGISVSTPADFLKSIDNLLTSIEIDRNAKEALKKVIILNFEEFTNTSRLKERLQLLFEYERNYLGLIKEFKEEIKFVGTLQEDLRKERAKFFSDTLREVSEAMRDAQVSSDVASQWIQQLVNSYTRSLDVSSDLIEEHTFDTIGEIRKQAKIEINTTTAPSKSDEKA